MNQGNEHIKEILESIEAGRLSAEEGYARLKLAPFEDLGYAKVDHHRRRAPGRCGSHLRRFQDQGTD